MKTGQNILIGGYQFKEFSNFPGIEHLFKNLSF